MKRILIDGRFVGVGDSMTRYCLETLKGILKLDQQSSYTLLLRPVGKKELEWYPEITAAKNLTVEYLDVAHYSLAEQTKFLSYLSMKKYDLVHFIQFNHPIRYKENFVVTIHDLILINNGAGNTLKKLAYRKVMRSAAEDSQKIIAVSEFTKKDLEQTFKIDGKKIDVIYHGIDHERFNLQAKSRHEEIDQFRAKHKIEHEYLLYVGAWKEHKNLLGLLHAFERFRDKSDRNLQLVLVGKVDPKEKLVVEAIERINSTAVQQSGNKAIVLTGPIDVRSEDLPVAYAGASAYIIPSFAEGFGWPPLEAMACGTPVIASKASCVPEILGDAAYYFDPKNVDEMAKAIDKVITDHTLRKDLIGKGLLQVQKYNWEEAAKQTLDVYTNILNQY